MASTKGHARKAGRPFELTTEFVETLYTRDRHQIPHRRGAQRLPEEAEIEKVVEFLARKGD